MPACVEEARVSGNPRGNDDNRALLTLYCQESGLRCVLKKLLPVVCVGVKLYKTSSELAIAVCTAAVEVEK